VAYYAARAAEYDITSYGNLASADRRIARLVSDFHPGSDLPEITCGDRNLDPAPGCTRPSVTAIDAAPEMISLARRRVTGEMVTFLADDVLSWSGPPPRRFDTVFFAFWLSHVPSSAFG
jgi:2-polyprenyl-3-methyl-5-hydroxy-6-metoxy-1,4-benzoquinol methylase